MKFLSYNIQYSKGLDDVYDLSRAADVMRGADIIGLQEVTRNLPNVPDSDQPAVLSDLLPEYFTAYGTSMDFDAGSTIDGGRAVSRRLNFGNMILSKWPILSTRNFTLPWSGLYHDQDMQNTALEAVIETPSGLLRVYATHLNYRRSSLRREQLEWLVPKLFAITSEGLGVTGQGFGAELGDNWDGLDIPKAPESFVVMGDFNLTPDCEEYSTIVGENDFHYGRFVTSDKWVDTWTQAGHRNKGAVSWIDVDKDEGLKLDYGFVSPDLAKKVVSASIDNDCIASDHKPCWFELDM